MPLYCKKRTAFRAFVLAVCAAMVGPSVALFARENDYVLDIWVYVTSGIVLLLISTVVLYQFVDPLNRVLIHLFGRRQLTAERRKVALEIVSALFERRQWDLPENDDDLMVREAALNFAKFFRSKAHNGFQKD